MFVFCRSHLRSGQQRQGASRGGTGGTDADAG